MAGACLRKIEGEGSQLFVCWQNPNFPTATQAEQAKAFSEDMLLSVWEAQFQTLLLLNHEQRTKYIRLKYELLPSKTIGDWIDSIPQEARRKLAREIFVTEGGR